MKLIDTCETKKAENLLRKYTNKPIIIKNILDLGLTYSGANIENDSEIIIYLRNDLSVTHQESVYIHELLHSIIRYQGYPDVHFIIPSAFANEPQTENVLKKISGDLSSSLTHPKIYNMMINDFNLDIEEYFNELVKSKDILYNRPEPELEHDKVFRIQQGAVIGYEVLFYQSSQKEIVLNLMKEKEPDAYNVLQKIKRDVAKYDCSKINDINNIFKIIIKHIKKYASNKKIRKINNFWDALILSI